MNQVSELKTEVVEQVASFQTKSQSNDKKNDCCVQVAVRVRPFINKELVDCESSCVKCSKTKITIGADKDFEFDKVIDQEAVQEEVYKQCVNELLLKIFEGYNATILAYGQTGSGKTFTMGTSNASLNDINEMGIIPRVIREIFKIRRERENFVDMILKISYFEIYNDNIIDLLDPNTIVGANSVISSKKGKGSSNNGNNIFIREEQDGSINLYGITEEKVNSPEEMLAALERGGLCRSTSATLMNQTSSRSHAVFTIFLEQHNIEDQNKNTDGCEVIGDESEVKKNIETIINEGFKTSKFHFVDLAGSERIKKTGAVGNTLKEGININMGLLSLGNVIQALTEPQKIGAPKKHIPYRDSKLTRILQDSLGGNSNTLMIACVSPAESNFEESLNTLKYASRARRIKNKPIINRDPQSALISSLKQQIQEANLEIAKYRQILNQNNIQIPDNLMSLELNSQINQEDYNQIRRVSQDLNILKQNSNRSVMFQIGQEAEMEELKQLRLNQVKLEKKIKELQAENGSLKSHNYKGEIEILTIQRERDEYRLKLEKIVKFAKEKGIFPNQPQQEINEDEDKNKSEIIYLNAEGEPEIKIDISQKSLIDEYNEKLENFKNDIKKKDLEYREIQIEFDEGIKASLRDQQMLIEREKKINIISKNLKNKESELKKAKDELQNLKLSSVKLQSKPSIKIQDEESIQQKINNLNFEDDDDNINLNIIQKQNNEDEDVIDEQEFEKIVSDPEFVKMESQLKLEEDDKKIKLSKVDGSIQKKSEEFRRLNQHQLELQKQLLEKMKEQYHQKINNLEFDMKKIENQRDQALQKLSNTNTKEAIAEKQRVIENFKLKVTEMQSNLNEYKKKAREQETLQKTVQSQEKQIQQLGSEITKFKSLKTNLYKEMKKNNEEFEKYKLKKYKEFMQEKKKNIEKEKKIFKLQNQTKKQEHLLQKKQEEFNKLVRSKDLIKKIISSSNQSAVSGIKGKMAHQRIPRKQKPISVKLDENENLDSSLNSPNNQISVESFNEYPIDEALDICLCKLIESIETQLNIEKAENDLKNTLLELEDAQQKSIEFKINLEKRERGLSEGIICGKKYEDSILCDELMEQQHQQLDQQKMELEEIQSRLESLEAKYEFKKEKISKLYTDQRSSNFEVLQNQFLTSTKYNNLQTQKILLKYLLEKFGSSTTENLKNQEKIESLSLQIEDSQQFILLLQNQKEISQIQMKQQIDLLQQQLQIALAPSQQQMQSCQYDSDMDINQTIHDQNLSLMNSSSININRDGRRMTKNQVSPQKQISSDRYKSMRQAHQAEQSPYRKDGKNLEDHAKLQQKQINDLTKQLKQNEIRVKTLQNKNETLQQKYDDLKKANCKNKFIGINKQIVDEDASQIGQMNSSMANSQILNGSILQNLNNTSSNQTTIQPITNTSMINSNIFQQQIQSLNTSKTSKEVAIQSLRDRRREVKGKSGTSENTPINNTNLTSQNSPPLTSTLKKSSSKKQLEQQNFLLENRDQKNIQQDQQPISNNEGSQSSISSFVSKTQVQSLVQKRLQLNEARKKKYSQQSQKLQQYIQQQSQIPMQFQQSYQQFGINLYQQEQNNRGGISVGSTPNLDNNSVNQNSVIENENQSQNKKIDSILNISTENTQSQFNSLGFNTGSPVKSLEQSSLPLTINNNYSPAGSDDLSSYHLQQNQIQLSVNSIKQNINENSYNNLSNSQNTFNLIAEFSVNNQLPNSLNHINNNYGSGFKNSLESNSNGIQSPIEENNFSSKYECVGKISDAHSGQVFCVQSHENFLFSTSVKQLKIWDQETLKCISDIQAHNHFVKGLTILEQEKWIVTACDKYINIWDMISLQKVCTLTGHNTDIKQLYVDNNVLYSVGKGTSNYGALVTWDIRKQQVIDEREKNQDIFSVLPYNNIIYYASRDHYVRRINMENNQSIDPFKPPHYDAVTSLAILNGYLVSGSKDHNLKLWSTQQSNTFFKQQTYYSNEQIMCLESNKDRNLLYVGQKDGKIRIITTQNNKFKDVSDINNGLQSVNCIAKIQNSATENMFVCGTADKFIKIWKPAQDSSYSMPQLKNLNSGLSNIESYNNNNNISPFQYSQNDQNVIIDEE